MASGKGSTSAKSNTKKSTSKTNTAKKASGAAKTNKTNGAKSTKTASAKNSSAKGQIKKTASKPKTPAMTKEEYERLHEKERMFKNEIGILISVAISLFLFFSNLNLCGTIGEFFHKIMCGSMGVLGYAFPVYITVAVCFILLVKGSFKPVFKMIAAVLLYWSLCGIVELFFGGKFDSSLELADYYNKGLDSVGGGLLGGIITKNLVPNISSVGTVIMLLVILLITIVYISEHSIVKPVGEKSKKVYTTAKEDLEKHRADRKRYHEEVKKIRERNYFQPDIDGDNRANVRPNLISTIKDRSSLNKTPVVNGLNGSLVVNQNEKTASPFIDAGNRGKMSKVNEFIITIDEDKEHVKPANAPADWYRDIEEKPIKHEYTPPKKDDIDNIDVIFDEDFKVSDEARNEILEEVNHCEYDELKYDSEIYEDILADDTGRTSDIRRVVTATGRIIENEIDPTEDPIAAKRKKAGSISTININSTSGTANKTGSGDAMFERKEYVKPPKKEKPYVKPPIRLLSRQTKSSAGMTKEALNNTAMKLEQTLRDFGVGVTVTDYSCGPSVTRYELQPDHGVKVSRIVALADDIKLNLAAADIRIEAPIPGKSVVGIEVPNKENSTVYFRNVIESDDFCNHPSKLAFAVGKDIGGNNIVTDLARMPHLLIAGATGSGKSVCINTLIMSILYKSTPEEVQLLMIDPKVVELSVYNGIPHLKYPVVTDPKLASGALNWAVAEMTDRYKKFAEHNVRDIKGYNDKVELLKAEGEDVAKLPQIVIIVDELADLMMVAPGEVEDSICRLAQMARAAGLHLVIATQRPSVNVITGLIKANIPSRIAFSVSSGVDSRTIIDMNGAEKLLGRGDMLFYPNGYTKPIRVQGAFISDNEVSKVVEFLSGNTTPTYDNNITEAISKYSSSSKDVQSGKSSDSQYDEYFEKAGRFIIEKDKASIGMLQRMFKIGFNRAARIMDQLAEVGVVGEEEGTKPRKVLMSMEQFELFIEECL